MFLLVCLDFSAHLPMFPALMNRAWSDQISSGSCDCSSFRDTEEKPADCSAGRRSSVSVCVCGSGTYCLISRIK